MNSKLIIVTGYLAAVKTTFALNLSQELRIPCFSKDLLKISLSRALPVNDRDGSKRLSAAAFDAIEFIAERFMETHCPLIIEANFDMDENHGGIKEGDALKMLADRYNYRTLTYLFTGDPLVLFERFKRRDKMPQRGRTNYEWGEFTLKDYENAASSLERFNIGGQLERIDSTDYDSVDFAHHIETARKFIGLDEVDYTMY